MNYPPLIKPFVAGERPGASRLNQLVTPLNRILHNPEPLQFDGTTRFIGSAVFKVSAAVAGMTGYYTMKRFSAPMIGAPAGNLVDAHLGTLSDSDDLLGVNLNEINGGGSPIAVGFVGVGSIFSHYAASQGGNDALGSLTFVLFSPGGSLPQGQYQDQMFGMVSQNQTGFKFITAHAME